MQVLHVVANPKPTAESASKQITEVFFDALKEKNPDVRVTTVDLYQDPPPYYDYRIYRNFWYPLFQPGYQPTPDERKAAEYAARHGKLFNQADVLVVTAPMWNFAVPAILKAWTDQVLSPGLTFTIGAEGVKPLHKVKKLILLTASGGAYQPGDERDNFLPQIKAAFGFAGISEVEVARADGQNTFFFKDHAERKAKAAAEARRLGERTAIL